MPRILIEVSSSRFDLLTHVAGAMIFGSLDQFGIETNTCDQSGNFGALGMDENANWQDFE